MGLHALCIHTDKPAVQRQTRTATIHTQQYGTSHIVHTHRQTSGTETNSYCPNTYSAVWDFTHCAYTLTNQQYRDKLVLPQHILSSMGLHALCIHTDKPAVQRQTRTAPIHTRQYGTSHTVHTHRQTSSTETNPYCPNTNSAV